MNFEPSLLGFLTLHILLSYIVFTHFSFNGYMTIERLSFPPGAKPITGPLDVQHIMVTERNNFQIVPTGEHEISPGLPRGIKYSRVLKVYPQGEARMGPNSNPAAVVFESATRKKRTRSGNGEILLEQPGDIFVLVAPSKRKGETDLLEIIKFTRRVPPRK